MQRVDVQRQFMCREEYHIKEQQFIMYASQPTIQK
jgi:hypothetical protein